MSLACLTKLKTVSVSMSLC